MSDFPDIPGYRIERLLGRGGMAAVYLATQLSLGRTVALKVFHPEPGGEARGRERFLREARALAEIRHPNVVTVHDVATHGDCCFMAMEYLPGGSLTEKIGSRPSLPESLSIVAQIGSALSTVHARGIVHRDVKPDNVLFRDDATPVLTDFGIAKRDDGEDRRITEQGVLLGTPAYMSPEQIDGKAVDARTDLYSLGVVFYELLLGETPFAGGGSQDQLIAHLTRPVPRLPERLQSFQPVIDRSMAKRPENRYRDVDQMIKDLGSRLLGDPTGWSTGDSDSVSVSSSLTERLRALGFPSGIGMPLSEHPTIAMESPRHRRLITLAATVLAMLAVAAYAFWPARQEAVLAPAASTSAPDASSGRSIAVLPFRDLSQSGDQGWMADGISEELIVALSRLPDLRVAARSSSFRFRGDALDVREVGRQLGVRHLLEGSVRMEAGMLRISAQLVEADKGEQVWARSFEFAADAVLLAQKSVAGAVAETLFDEPAASTDPRLLVQPAVAPKAYELFLQARQAARDGKVEGHQRELQLLEQAVSLDPGFARAHAHAARSVIVLHQRGALEREAAIEQAQTWLSRATELAPADADTLLAEGALLQLKHDLAGAERAFRAVLDIDPNHVIALGLLDYVLWDQGGREAEELPLLKRTTDVDPLSVYNHYNLAELYVQLGDFATAEKTYRRTIRLAPDAAFGYTGLGRYQWLIENDPTAALSSFRDAHARDPRSTRTLAFPAIMLLELDMLDEAADWLAVSDDWQIKDVHLSRAHGLLALMRNGPRAAAEWVFPSAEGERNLQVHAGQLAWMLGDRARARDHFAVLIEGDPRHTKPNRRNLRALIGWAAVELHDGDAEVARAMLERAQEFIHTLPARGADGALLAEVDVQALLGRHDEALELLAQLRDKGVRDTLLVDIWRPESNPWLAPLRNRPGFTEYLAQEAQHRSRLREGLLPVAGAPAPPEAR